MAGVKESYEQVARGSIHYSTENNMTDQQITIVRQRTMWRVRELAALAREIATTERLPEVQAWRKAHKQLGDLMAYAREWDKRRGK